MFDDLRTLMPDVGFALYALEPKAPVTFEIITADGEVFSFTGSTAKEAIEKAFPPAAVAPTTPTPATPAANIFD